MAYLEMLNAPDATGPIVLTGNAFVIGRDDQCDLIVRDAAVSRRHAQLERVEGTWRLVDLKSKNRVTVNGEEVEEAALRTGDVLGVANLRLRFVAEDGEKLVRAIDRVQAETLLQAGRTKADPDHRLNMLLQVVAALGSATEPEQMLARFGELMVDVFTPSRCLVEVEPRRWGRCADMPGREPCGPVGASESVKERVLRGESVLLANVQDAQQKGPSGPSSVMGAPVFEGEAVIGWLYVDRSATPFQEQDLLYLAAVGLLVGAALAQTRRIERLREENEKLRGGSSSPAIVGSSPAIRRLREDIDKRVGPVRASVLVLGETGTGKNLAATAIHAASPRASGPFVEVNCAAIPRELLESELFGHEKGAFSGATARKAGQFELASGGTLFLDEVGELDQTAQAKLLAVVQEQRVHRVGGTRPIAVDVRIIAATNRDLPEEVRAGRFRSDLFYRLNVVSLQIPSLRDRKEDIPAFVDHFLKKACREMGRRIPGVTPDAMAILRAAPWPGNVRQLANAIERAVIFADDGRALDTHHLPAELMEVEQEDGDAAREQHMIVEALEACGGNKRAAARQLGWYPQKFYSRLKRYGIG